MVVQCFRMVTALLALFAFPALAKTHIQPRLIAESSAPAAGSTVTIALEMRTEKGWHGYWSNPGQAGFAPRLVWTLPRGATMGAPEFPVPTTLTVAGLMNYVFEADHALIFAFKVPAGLAPRGWPSGGRTAPASSGCDRPPSSPSTRPEAAPACRCRS